MSATGEVENASVAQPMTEVAVKEQSKPAEKPVKEKKPKEMKPRYIKNVSHPPYFEMIKEALLALKEKGGSSPYAIGNFMEEKYKAMLPENFRKILGHQLKNSASKGKLIKVKASYKLSESGKKNKATTKAPKTVAAKKKPEQAKYVAAKSVSKGKLAKKSGAVKKTKSKAPAGAAAPKAKAVQETMKRAAPAKTRAKQPKSIKSSPAKKAKKAAT